MRSPYRPRRSPEEKAKLCSQARALVAAGRSIRFAAGELRVDANTLSRWLKEEASQQGSPRRLARVQVLEPSMVATAPTLVTPEGYRVEGLDLEQLADLLGRLR